MSQYQDTISLICHIYEKNGKHPPSCYKEMMSTQESREFALHVFAVLMETIELMDDEDYVVNNNKDYVMSSDFGFTNEDLKTTVKTLLAYKQYLEKEEPYALVTMNDIQNVVDGLPESVEDLEEFKKGEW